MRSLADELSTPKYAHVERERRWLVDRSRRPPLEGDHVLIEDRYLTGTRLRLRRMTDSATGAVGHKLTKKYATEIATARPIVTAYLTAEEFAVFAALPAQAITKRRYPVGGFSVDVFGAVLTGLELAEIERPDAASLAAVAAPTWVAREITGDAGYSGAMLAAAGRPET